MGSFWSALRFLTIVPLDSEEETQTNLGQSLAFFPLVGALIGLVAAGLNQLLLLIFPASVTNLLIIFILVILRGGLHLDGLMDTADGLFSQKERSKMLEVMRDSRAGAFGAIALVSSILIKWSTLNQLDPVLKWRALVLVPALGEWAIVYAAVRYTYAREGEGKGRVFTEQAHWGQFAVATLITLFLSVLLFSGGAFLLLAVFAVLAAALAAYIAGKLGGFTGDAYGALAESGEILGFLLILATFGH